MRASRLLYALAVGGKVVFPFVKSLSSAYHRLEISHISLQKQHLECCHIIKYAAYLHHPTQIPLRKTLIQHGEVVAEVEECLPSYGAVGTSDDEDNAKKSSDTVLSLDALPEEDVKSSAWLADPANNIEMALTEMCIEDFRKSLSSIQLEIFDVVMLGGVGVREYARQKGINHKTVVEAIASMRKKLKKIF